MATNSINGTLPGGTADGVTWIVENDQRRSRIGLHVGSAWEKPAALSLTIWLDPARAEEVAASIGAAAARLREHEAAVSWTAPAKGGAA